MKQTHYLLMGCVLSGGQRLCVGSGELTPASISLSVDLNPLNSADMICGVEGLGDCWIWFFDV